MPLVAMVCASLLGLADGMPPPAPADVAAEYRRAGAAAGRGSGDQVRLALWCEAHGLSAERARHLALAVLADPGNAMARGLAGLVARDGRWARPEAVAESVRSDPVAAATLAEYDDGRSKAPYTADAQWALALWADERGLRDQARAHFTAVARLDPSRDAAWKRLGYKKVDGRWATDAQLAAARAEADAQKAADKAWRPRLEKWRAMLAKPAQRDEARAALLGVTDPRAIASILRVFGTDKAEDQQVAIGLLGQVESPQSSRALAMLAVAAKSPEARRAALETLRSRDPRDFVGSWIALIRPTIKYQVRPVGGPGSPGALFIAGAKANTQRNYRPLAAPDLADYAGMTPTYDAQGRLTLVRDQTNLSGWVGGGWRLEGLTVTNRFGSPNSLADLSSARSVGDVLARVSAGSRGLQRPAGPPATTPNPTTGFGVEEPIVLHHVEVPIERMMRDASASAEVARQQLKADVAQLDAFNAAVRERNDPVLVALRDATGQDFGEDSLRWERWWADQQGYAAVEAASAQVPTVVEDVPIGFTPVAVPTISSETIGFARLSHSCFAAGTPVRTVAGTKPIKQVRRGDLVLVQDTVGGGLSYQPVLTAFHNPPSTTYRVRLGDDEVRATGIHRFWKAGHGWAMARDLKPGDALRVLGGVASVESVTPEQAEPVFNLEVAEGRSFFVGRVGALVHDNSPVEATPDPFDAARPVGAAVAAKADAPR